MALTDSLRSWWDLAEATSAVRRDYHGDNHLEDNSDVALLSGAADFDGTSWLSHAVNSDLTQSGSFTVFADIEFDVLSSVRSVMAIWPSGGTGGNFQLRYWATPDRIQLIVRNAADDATGTISADTLGSPSTATRYRVVAWYDASAETINIQVNNGTVDSAAWTQGINGTVTPVDFLLGAFDDGAGQFLDGKIYEAGIWNGVLSSADRTTLYNSGSELGYAAFGNVRQAGNVTQQLAEWTPGKEFLDRTIVPGDLWLPYENDITNPNWADYQPSLASIDLSGTKYQAAAWWDRDLKMRVAVRTIGGSWTTYTTTITNSGDDHHDVVALGLDALGYIHIAYDMHNEALNKRRSSNTIDSFDGTFGSAESNLVNSSNEGAVTYPYFFNQSNGELGFLFRNGSGGAGDADTFLYFHTASTNTWATPSGLTDGLLVQGTGGDPESFYHGMPVVDSLGRIHFSGMFAEDAADRRDAAHWLLDGTSWEQADGSAQTVPVTNVNASYAATGSTDWGHGLGQILAADSSDNPHVMYVSDDGAGTRRRYHTYWTGSAWSSAVAISEHRGPGAMVLGSDDTAYIMEVDRRNNRAVVHSSSSPYSTWAATTVFNREIHTPHVIDQRRWDDDGILSMLSSPNHQLTEKDVVHDAFSTAFSSAFDKAAMTCGDTRITNRSAKAMCDAIVDLIDAGTAAGTVKLYSGTQPASADATVGGATLLATVGLNDPAFGAAADAAPGAIATANVTPALTGTGVATGTLAWFRAADSAGATVFDGGSANITVDNASIASGQTVEVTSFTFTMPEQ